MPRPRLSDRPARPRSFILDDALWEKMRVLATERQCSTSQIGRIAIEHYLSLYNLTSDSLPTVPHWSYPEFLDEHLRPVHPNGMPVRGKCVICDLVQDRGFRV